MKNSKPVGRAITAHP